MPCALWRRVHVDFRPTGFNALWCLKDAGFTSYYADLVSVLLTPRAHQLFSVYHARLCRDLRICGWYFRRAMPLLLMRVRRARIVRHFCRRFLWKLRYWLGQVAAPSTHSVCLVWKHSEHAARPRLAVNRHLLPNREYAR